MTLNFLSRYSWCNILRTANVSYWTFKMAWNLKLTCTPVISLCLRFLQGKTIICSLTVFATLFQDLDFSSHPREPCILKMYRTKTDCITTAASRATGTRGRPGRATAPGSLYQVKAQRPLFLLPLCWCPKMAPSTWWNSWLKSSLQAFPKKYVST